MCCCLCRFLWVDCGVLFVVRCLLLVDCLTLFRLFVVVFFLTCVMYCCLFVGCRVWSLAVLCCSLFVFCCLLLYGVVRSLVVRRVLFCFVVIRSCCVLCVVCCVWVVACCLCLCVVVVVR